MTRTRRSGLVLALVTATISAFSVYVNALGVRAFESATVYTTAKNAVAALILGVVAIVGASLARTTASRTDTSGSPARLSTKDRLGLLAVGLVGGSVPFVLFFEGLARASSPQAAFIHKTLVVWVAILAVLILRERLGWPHYLAIGLLLIGQVGLSNAGLFPLDTGALMILAATLLWSIEVIIAKRLLSRVPSRTVAIARMGLGAVVLVLWVAVQGQFAALFAVSAAQLQWLALTGLLLAGYVSFWLAALARAQAVDVTAILVVGAVGTAVIAFVNDGVALAPQAPWLGVLVLATALVGWSMVRRPTPALQVADPAQAR